MDRSRAHSEAFLSSGFIHPDRRYVRGMEVRPPVRTGSIDPGRHPGAPSPCLRRIFHLLTDGNL